MTPRQGNLPEPAYAYPDAAMYGYTGQTLPKQDKAGHYEPRHQQTGPNYCQFNDQSGAQPSRQALEGYRTQLENQHQVNINALVAFPAVANPQDLRAKIKDDASWNTGSRRPARASISDRSDATASSNSDISSLRSVSEDLQGLSLGDHPLSQLIQPSGASSRGQHWDPILGDVQRDHDTLVVSFTTVPETSIS